MSRLFLRVWFGFWGVLAATFLLALAVNYGLAVARARDVVRLNPTALADQAAAEIAQRGEFMGRHWLLKQRTRHPELTAYIVAPDGHELGGHSPQEVAHALSTRPKGRSPFPAAVDERIGGRTYRFVFERSRSLSFDLWDILLQPWVLVGLVLAVSGLGSAWLTRSISVPVGRLQTRVRAVADGELTGRMGPALTGRRDELGALARAVDDMAARLQALIAAREAMLRDVSHELRAPLARLRAVADLARKRGGHDETFARIDREVDRLDAMIGQFLKFSRLEAEAALATEPLDLAALIEDLAEDARLEAAPAGKTVTVSGASAAPVLADARLLRSALENVLRNAVRFSPPKGAIEVEVAAHPGEASVRVRDRGPGVEAQDLERIFEPFQGEGSGAGLGLAIARRVAVLHGGRIAAENREGGGLVVTVALPSPATGG